MITAALTTDALVDLNHCYPSPHNPRTIAADDPALAELAQSIQHLGLLQPIVVREKEAAGVPYEILAGHRRFTAAKMAGMAMIPARILRDCDDRLALEITVVENLQRQDLQPLEEARGVAALLAGGWPALDIATHLGKSERWVYLRAKLRDLSPAWHKALEDQKCRARELSAGALELIARHTIADQDTVLEQYFGKRCSEWSTNEAINRTVAEWVHYLEECYLRTLKSAKWDLEDTQLVAKAGACSACPKRSSCQQMLFTMGKTHEDRCTDSACWSAKHSAWLKQREQQLAAEHGKIQRVSTEFHTAREMKIPEIGKYCDLEPAKKTDPKAKPVMPIDGPRAGQLVWVAPAGSHSDRGSSSKAKAAAKPKSDKVKRTEGRERWLGSRAKAAMHHFRQLLEDQDKPKQRVIPAGESCSLLVLLSLAFKTLSSAGSYDNDFDVEGYEALRQLGPGVVDPLVWVQVAEAWAKTLPGPNADLPTHRKHWPRASGLARHIGLAAIIDRFEDTARAEVPVPKRLAPFFDDVTGEPLSDAPTDAKKSAKAAAKTKAKKPAEKATTTVAATKAAKPKKARAAKQATQGGDA